MFTMPVFMDNRPHEDNNPDFFVLYEKPGYSRVTLGAATMYARYELHEGHPPKITPRLVKKAMEALAGVYTGIMHQHVKVNDGELVVFDRPGKKGSGRHTRGPGLPTADDVVKALVKLGYVESRHGDTQAI